MFHLTLHWKGPDSCRTIAEQQNSEYLEQLIGALHRAGLVTNIHEAQGGYTLAIRQRISRWGCDPGLEAHYTDGVLR